jgi:hypothetical protein
MTSLFTQYWDVIPGKFDEYSAFVSKDYLPTMEKLGLKVFGGFYVAVGQGPRTIVVGTVEEQDYLRCILSTEEHSCPVRAQPTMRIRSRSESWHTT